MSATSTVTCTGPRAVGPRVSAHAPRPKASRDGRSPSFSLALESVDSVKPCDARTTLAHRRSMANVPVDVGAHALRASARSHLDSADKLANDGSATVALLLFYAAECSLKAALLVRQSLRDTASLPEELRSHDLRRMMKELRLPPTISLSDFYRCTPMASRSNARIPPSELHQAWRYGRALASTDHDSAVTSLRAILSWCEHEKGKGK